MNKKYILLLSLSLIFLSGCSLIENFRDNDDINNHKEDTITETVLDSYHETEENTDNESNETEIESIEEESNEEETNIEESNDESSSLDNEENHETDSNIDISNIKVGDQINIDNSFPVYSNAMDAYNQVNSSINYSPGTYYVYKIHQNAINLSKTPGQAGGWANFNLFNESGQAPTIIDVTSPEGTNQIDSPKENVEDMTPMSWSWAYPNTASYMNQYRALYNTGESNTIYLTFDNGYEYNNLTSNILDTLSANNVKAVFFVTSSYMRDNPTLTRRIVNEGHNLANHTHNHLSQGKVSSSEVKNDILAWEDTYRNILNSEPTTSLMRPPTGSYNVNSLKIASDLGYKTVFWNYAYNDWDTSNQPDPNTSLNNLLANNESGSIVLLHSVSQTNANILDQYIKGTKAQGFNFKLLH